VPGGFATVDGFQEWPTDRRWIAISWIAPKYFETLGTPVLAGRDVNFGDCGRSPVAIINQRMARYYFPRGNAIGNRVTLDHVTGAHESHSYEVVGIVGNTNYLEIRETPQRIIYLAAFRDKDVIAENLVLRTTVDPEKFEW
jgi:hypothetical protein